MGSTITNSARPNIEMVILFMRISSRDIELSYSDAVLEWVHSWLRDKHLCIRWSYPNPAMTGDVPGGTCHAMK